MRKITEESCPAFVNNYDYNKDNTRVVSDKHNTYLYLHGNMIAKRVNGQVFISHSGWETATTKERLNGVLDFLGQSRIYQKDFVWYWKDGEEFKSGWNKI